MAEEETRKVKIIWEVEDDTQKGVDSAVRRQKNALTDLSRSSMSSGPVDRSAQASAMATKAAADLAKVGQAAERTTTPLGKMGAGIADAAVGTKRLAEQAQSVIGKLSGMAGAAGLAIAAVSGIALATYDWVTAQQDVEEAAIKRAYTMAKLDAEQKIRQDAIIKRLDIEAQRRQWIADARTDRENEAATRLDREAETQEALGASVAHVNDLRIKALEIKREQAILDIDEVERIDHQIGLLRISSSLSAVPTSGGNSGPSAADRLRAAGEGRIQLLNDEIELSDTLYKLNGTAAESALSMVERRRAAKMAELQLERDVLDVTRAKNAVERVEIDNRKAHIEREMALTNVDALVAAKQLENEQTAIAVSLARAKEEIEGRAAGRIISLTDARMSRSIEQAKLDNDGARVHELTIAQLGQQEASKEKLLDLRERELLISNPTEEIDKIKRIDDLEQVAHDRGIARLEAGLAVQRTVAAEEARLAAEKEARLAEYTANVNTAIGTFESIQGSFQSVVSDFTGRMREQQDADLAEWKSNLEARTQSQSAALDRQIEQAQGNANLRRDLERRKASLEKASQKQIEAAETAHNAKRQRAEMRHQGIMLLVQGAVQVAKAAAAYPVVPSMVAHGIAAGLNFAYGAMLLAGKVPGAGGGAAGRGGGGESNGNVGALVSKGGTGELNRVPESVGGRAAERQGSRGRTIGGQSGNVTFQGNVTINALGSVDEDAATKIGMAVNQGKHIREGAAIK